MPISIQNKIILPEGFQASGIHCGIKRSGKLDLALFYSRVPARAACVFTKNSLAAAPVIVSRQLCQKSAYKQAVLINSGNANCFTGQNGLRDAKAAVESLAAALAVPKAHILVASTGIIGKPLPAGKIRRGLPELVKRLSSRAGVKASSAMITTDKFRKEVTAKINLSGKSAIICGIAKGAGMIAPDMATMLCVVLTDAVISSGRLNQALRSAVNVSFNSITVDGCMSTNDSVMLLANGQAGNSPLAAGRGLEEFSAALTDVCLTLAKMIVRDGEGATKLIRIIVDKAKHAGEAKRVAVGIANSSLFKTAMYGENPNFGRVAAAVGASGVDIKESDLKIQVSSLKHPEVCLRVSLGRGQASATVYTSDLTPEYVKINAEYN